ncbi:hypothetical protein GF391_04275 [Candidatus Uhrbacteria bacterium]|nr:hypothetical protein [Candidatus Uhrbacteria bacterium]
MSLRQLLNAGIKLHFCPDACVPEIPRVQDVLYALQLVEKDECYRFGLGNHITYVRNVHIVASAVSYDVLGMERYDEREARRIIAGTIFQLCPDEARCSEYISAYRELLNILGHDATHDANECVSCLARAKAEREQELRQEIGWQARYGD